MSCMTEVIDWRPFGWVQLKDLANIISAIHPKYGWSCLLGGSLSERAMHGMPFATVVLIERMLQESKY